MMWAGLDTEAHAAAAAQVWGSMCVNTVPESTKEAIGGEAGPAKKLKTEPQQTKKTTADGGAVPCPKKESSTRKCEKGPETKAVVSNDTSSPENKTKNKTTKGKKDIGSQEAKICGPSGVACPQKSVPQVTTRSEKDNTSNVDSSHSTKLGKNQQKEVASKPCQSSGTSGIECQEKVAKTTADSPPISDKDSNKKNCKIKPAATAAQDSKNFQSAHRCSSDVQVDTKNQKLTAKDSLLCASTTKPVPLQAQTLSPELTKLEAATPEEIAQFPHVCSSFAHHLIHKVRLNESTAVQYVQKLQELFQEHQRSLKVMCSTENARLAQGGRISVSLGAMLREFDGFSKLWRQDEKTLMSVSATFWEELSTKRATKDSSNPKRRKVTTDAEPEVKTNLCPQATEVSKNVQATEVSKNVQATEVPKNSGATEVSKNSQATNVSKNAQATGVSKNAQAKKVSRNSQASEVSKNAQATEVAKNAQATEVSKNAQATEVSKNAHVTEVSKNVQFSTSPNSTGAALQTWYLVKQSFRGGLGLQTGAVYSELELRNRCRDNAKKLAELEKSLKNPDLLTPISSPPIELKNQTAAAPANQKCEPSLAAMSKTPPRKDRDMSSQESAQKGVKHATSAKDAFFAAFAKGAETKADTPEKSDGQTQPSEKAAEQNSTACARAVENSDSSQKPQAKAGSKRKSSVTGSNAPDRSAKQEQPEGQTLSSEKIAEQSKRAEEHNLQKPQAKACAKRKFSATVSNAPEGSAADKSSEGPTLSSEKVAEQSKSAEKHDLQKPQPKASTKRKSVSNVIERSADTKTSPPDEEIKQNPTTSTDADSSNSSNDVPKGTTKLSAKRTKTSLSTAKSQ